MEKEIKLLENIFGKIEDSNKKENYVEPLGTRMSKEKITRHTEYVKRECPDEN